MANWPSIDEPKKIKERIIKVAHRSASESGYIATRAKWTGSRKAFSLFWPGMETVDKDTLETFFKDNQGTTFNWAHPVSGEYTCVFSSDEIEFDSVGFSSDTAIYAVTVDIEEQQ